MVFSATEKIREVSLVSRSGLAISACRNVIVPLLLCSLLSACSTPAAAPAAVDADRLMGTWVVDLRPAPDAPPYLQELVIESVEGQTFAGSFYGAEVTEARINADWGTLRIAFVTEDGSGPYHHSAVLRDSVLEGLSNSTGRDFLRYWSATRQ